jgi:hypothetical protein
MNERTITISVDEYRSLVEKSERIAAVERFFRRSEYVTDKDIKSILDINEPVTVGAENG